MKTVLAFSIICLLFSHCDAQEGLVLENVKYVGKAYEDTKNKSFVNKRMLFLKGKDTLYVNVKLPFDANESRIIDSGLYRDCLLQEGNIYTLRLKGICLSDIPSEYESYYESNAVFSNSKDCSQFVEYKKDSKYIYKGRYSRYVDFHGRIYEVVGLSPSDGCDYSH